MALEMFESMAVLSTANDQLLLMQVRLACNKQNPTMHLVHPMVLESASPRFSAISPAKHLRDIKASGAATFPVVNTTGEKHPRSTS